MVWDRQCLLCWTTCLTSFHAHSLSSLPSLSSSHLSSLPNAALLPILPLPPLPSPSYLPFPYLPSPPFIPPSSALPAFLSSLSLPPLPPTSLPPHSPHPPPNSYAPLTLGLEGNSRSSTRSRPNLTPSNADTTVRMITSTRTKVITMTNRCQSFSTCAWPYKE